MKRINKILIFCTIVLPLSQGCSMFKYDNYEGPDCTISGSIVDQDGNPLQVEHGGGARIKLMDYGYSDNPQEQYLNVKSDGTFINTKIFDSTYDIVAEGPFVPLVQVGDNSEIISDGTLHNVTKKDFKDIKFTVEPYLKLEWVGEPVIDAGTGNFSVQFRIDRGTDHPDYQKEMLDITLFINTVKYVGNGNYDKNISPVVSGTTADAMVGNGVQTITTEFDENHKMERGRPYYIRIGGRTNIASGIYGGTNYNFTTVKKIIIPEE